MSEFMLGQHEAKINAILEGLERMSADVAEIKTILAEKRGERRVALWGVGAVSSTITLLISYLTKLLVVHPK